MFRIDDYYYVLTINSPGGGRAPKGSSLGISKGEENSLGIPKGKIPLRIPKRKIPKGEDPIGNCQRISETRKDKKVDWEGISSLEREEILLSCLLQGSEMVVAGKLPSLNDFQADQPLVEYKILATAADGGHFEAKGTYDGSEVGESPF